MREYCFPNATSEERTLATPRTYSSPLIVLQVDHGGDGVVVCLEGDLGQPLPPDGVEAVQVSEVLLAAEEVVNSIETVQLQVWMHDAKSMQESVTGYYVSENQRYRAFTYGGFMRIFRIEIS